MSDQEEMPGLEDFESELKTIHTSKPKPSNSEQDYTTMNIRHIEDQQKQQQAINAFKQDVTKLDQQVQQRNKTKHKTQDYAGFKKGFLSAPTKPAKPSQNITELKVNKKVEPLRIPEVQEAMKMNNYLEETRKDWMTENFLNNVTSNDKINKLFTNPEYIKAIDMFKTNPKEAMVKYGNNKQFMEGFQEFCKMMGSQFQGLANLQKAKK